VGAGFMKNRNLLFSICIISAYFSSILPSDNRSNWCGNKHKNLVILRDALTGLNNVSVPEFVGISTSRVETFIQQYAPDVFAYYAYIIWKLSHEDDNAVYDTTLPPIDNRKHNKLYIPIISDIFSLFTPRQRTIQADTDNSSNNITNISLDDAIKHIQTLVVTAFRQHGKDFNFTPEERNLIATTDRNNGSFMVRSTGVEDSQTVANAGGNLSVAYVKPAYSDIYDAMGNVIASYFGKQSLMNRRAGGEQLSSVDICLPVLLQVVVGEKRGGAAEQRDIPVSGVAFTTQKSFSSENFLVTEVNASYGHGEGVVANRVAVDRYYLMTSRAQHDRLNMYPVIREKHERIVPHTRESGRLISVKNDKKTATQSCLSRDQLQHLYHVLKNIEQHYQQPMDVEFVIIGTMLYIVQARPAMRHDARPSYCAVELIPQDHRSTMTKSINLVTGSSELLMITKPEEIIIADTIDQAEQHPQSAQSKAVIVKTWCSSLSHAAVNFTSHGIPCLYVADTAQIKGMIMQASEDKPYIIDTQRGAIFQYQKNAEDFNQYIRQGWFEHPVERMISVWSDHVMKQSAVLVPPVPRDGKLNQLLEEGKRPEQRANRRAIVQQIEQLVMQRLALTEQRINHVGVLVAIPLRDNFNTLRTSVQQIIQEIYATIDQHGDEF